jgi:hypothetical protein
VDINKDKELGATKVKPSPQWADGCNKGVGRSRTLRVTTGHQTVEKWSAHSFQMRTSLFLYTLLVFIFIYCRYKFFVTKLHAQVSQYVELEIKFLSSSVICYIEKCFK